MKIVQALICFGLRHAAGEAAADAAGKGFDFLIARFTDESHALPKAIATANANTWKAFDVALAGDGFFDRCKYLFVANQTTRNIGRQMEPLLRAAAQGQPLEEYRQACLADLRKLRSDEFKAGALSAVDLQREATKWQRYGNPAAVVADACDAVNGVAQALEANYPSLARLLRQPTGAAPPLLASLFTFFLDKAITENQELKATLSFNLLRNLYANQETAFAGVGQAIDALGDRLDAILDGILSELQEIKSILKNFKPGVSYENEEERAFLRQQREKFRQLPPAQQKAADWSNMADRLGDAGLYDLAQEEHNNAAKAAAEENNIALAAAEHFKAFRAACEKEQWPAALASLRQAVALNPLQAPFDWEQFEVLEILGAGGGGTVFRCRDRHLDEEVAIKAIHTGDLARGVQEVFKEAAILTKLKHPAIIAVQAARFADAAKQRPYIVMEYFASRSLAARLKQQGPLPVAEFLRVVRPVAEALRAAHDARPKPVYHRDVKPDNVLLGDAGQIKVIDYGLAVRVEAVHKSTGTDPKRRSQKDQSYVGTLEYMPPEQQGGLKPVGPYSDIYAFGRTCCKLLFGFPTLSRHTAPKTQPETRHWNRKQDPVPQALVDLLERCVQHAAEDRPQDFQEVLDVLDQLEKPPPMAIPMVRFVCACGKRLKAPLAEAGRNVKCPDCSQSLVIPSQDADKPATVEPPPPPPLPKSFTNALGMQFVLAPPATFWMGERDAQKPVEIPHYLYMAIHPVTQGQWQALMGNNPSWFSRTGSGAEKVRGVSDADLKLFPVEQVSWKDAQQFIEKLNAREKDREWMYRLPTEAEWEYICRGGAVSQADCSFDFYFERPTNDASSREANFDGNHPFGSASKGPYLQRPTKVGSYKPNRLGVYDMHGNVWEWCQDVAEAGASDRVIRGGSWFYDGQGCRAADRGSHSPSYRLRHVGFRLARVPSGQ